MPDHDTMRELYRLQFRARLVEDTARDLFFRNLIQGTSHLAQGQEAIAAGFAAAMRSDDYTLCTYRGHHHVVARGVPVVGVLGELMGRECGVLGGMGGSMHLTSVEHGVMGSYAIVGAHLPIALGTAWSSVYRKDGRVTVCFFGDGTTNIGAFHEALNLAAVWSLPVVFVCENNLYMEYSAIADHTAVPRPAADRAAAYGLDRIVIDGNDADRVFETALATITAARNGDGPALIEALTYRQGGHSRADPAKYRPSEEVEAWLARDPINLYRNRLLAAGLTEAELGAIDEDEQSTVTQALAVAEASPAPKDADKNLWADGGTAWRS